MLMGDDEFWRVVVLSIVLAFAIALCCDVIEEETPARPTQKGVE